MWRLRLGSVFEKQVRLGDEAEQERSRQQEASRTREEEAHADMERAAAALKQICKGRAKKKSEERTQQKLRNLGVCGQNYPWIKHSSVYRCAGGSHFVSDSELFWFSYDNRIRLTPNVHILMFVYVLVGLL
jgi:hypothetical protein